MGFLNRLHGKTPARAGGAGAGRKADEMSLYPGNATLEVVGESHHQDTLWKIVAGHWPEPDAGQQTFRRGEATRYRTYAQLIPEPDNPHDENAIQVLIHFEPVGYLSSDAAATYLPGLLRLMEASANHCVAVPATIAGGGQRPDGQGFLGVFLDHNPADFGVNAPHAGVGFRTGRSAANRDGSCDLSWYSQLPPDDVGAIHKLRALLEAHDDPLDRHYLMSELERRLYKRRDAFASALDEFDAACQKHDAEMVTIRPALLDEFGCLPFIEIYRQAAIRSKKAHDWETARAWAERGLAVYGDDAGRPEDVDDLRQRRDYVVAKIEAANKPRANRARTTATR